MSISDFLFQAYFLTFFGEKFSYILFKGRFSIKAISSRCHKLFFAGSALKKMTFPIENLLPLLTADWAVYGMLPTLKAFFVKPEGYIIHFFSTHSDITQSFGSTKKNI